MEGKRGYKTHGYCEGLIGIIEVSDSGITPYVIRFDDGSAVGAFPQDISIVDDRKDG